MLLVSAHSLRPDLVTNCVPMNDWPISHPCSATINLHFAPLAQFAGTKTYALESMSNAAYGLWLN